jgi:hypothetical protein
MPDAEKVRPCVVEVGHPPGAPAQWIDLLQPTFAVCDRHRRQYDERDDLGPATAHLDGGRDAAT